MEYKGESKGMKINGFLSLDDVQLDWLVTDVARLVLPSDECFDNEKEQFFSMAHAMVEKKLVGIVRLVARDRDVPRMGLLYPRINREPYGMTFVEIAYEEQLYALPIFGIDENKYEKEKCPELEDLIDNVIDSTMLVADEKNKEPLALGEVIDPNPQALWNVISHRCLYPEEPLPKQELDNLTKVLDTPDYIKKKSKEHIQKLKKAVEAMQQDLESNKTTEERKNNEVEISLPPEEIQIMKPVVEDTDMDLSDLVNDM